MERRRTSVADRTSEARSRALEAFRVLMMERGYRRVTIQSVLERARIGRATFYVHFRGKEDLLAASVGGLGTSLAAAGRQQRASGIDEPLAFVRPLFHHLRRSRRMLSVLAERDTDVLLREHLMRTFAGLVRDQLTARHGRAPDEVAVQFVVGALWGVMMWWSRTPDVMPDAAADAFNALAAPVIGRSGVRVPTRGRARSRQR
jgi:AcrR family transcriptional regulator